MSKRILALCALLLISTPVYAQQAVNVSKVNGVTPSTGNGASGTGVQRVTIANDSTGVLAGITTVTTVTGVTNLATIGTSVTPGTSAAHLGKAEDAVASSGDTGVSVLALREDTPSGTAANGDYINLKTDSTGRLWVNCGTGCSGGTQYAEDAAHVSADTGTIALTKRTDTAASSAGTDGDYATLNSDANGRIWTNIFGVTQAAGTYITVRLSDGSSFLTPGTDYTEDAASAGAEAGPLMMSIRQDTPAGTVSADGDYQNLKTDSVGRLWVNCGTGCSGGTQYTHDAALTAGSTVGNMLMGRASAAAPTSVSADDDAVMQWHLRNGSQVVNLASGSTLLTATSTSLNVNCTGGCSGGTQYAEDAAHASGDSGTVALVKRTDSPASSAGTDGDYAVMTTDSAGRLWVRPQGQAVATSSVAGESVVSTGALAVPFAGVDQVLIVRPHAGLEDLLQERTTNTDGASTAFASGLAAPGSGIKIYLTSCTIANSSASFATVDLRDGSAGSVLWTIPVPATGGAVESFGGTPLKFSANTAVAFDASAATSTITISCKGFKSKV